MWDDCNDLWLNGTYVRETELYTERVHKSFEAKKFLREDEFIPSDIVILRSAFNKHGKIFLNQSCVILMENNKKQIELRNMVRDSGGAVLNWSCKDLALKRDVELMKVDFIVSNWKGLAFLFKMTYYF